MSNRGSYELAQALKNSGKMGPGAKIGIAFAVVVFIVGIGLLIAYAVNPDIFKPKKEGDVCQGNDVRGTYEIDEDGDCVLVSCQAGWEVDGKTCVKSITVPNVPIGPAPPLVQETDYDFCIKIGGVSTPLGFVWDFHSSTGMIGVTKPSEIVTNWKNDKYVNATGQSAKTLGYNWLAYTLTDGDACATYFVYGRTDPRTDDNIVDQGFCRYPSSVFGPQGAKPDSRCASAPLLSNHPEGHVTWRVLKLDHPEWEKK